MHVRNAAAWEKWLAAHVVDKGVWMQFAKKGQSVVSVNHADALDVALCHGWIDGQLKSMDTQFYLQRFTPRRAKGIWSKINIGKVEKFIAEGRMQPTGLREVDAAKTDGRWDAAYDSASTILPHEDLLEALKKNKKSQAVLRQSRQDQSLRGLLACADGQETGDPRGTHCETGGDVGYRRKNSSHKSLRGRRKTL